MLGIFVATPLLALLPAFVCVLVYWRTHRRSALVAAIAWLAYTLYEEAVRRRILCSGECNIRVDLLLLYPVLAVVSLAAVVSAVVAGPAVGARLRELVWQAKPNAAL